MIKVGSAKIVNFITIRAGSFMQGLGYISHYNEYALSSTLSINIILIAIVCSEYNAIIDFYSFYDGAADMQI